MSDDKPNFFVLLLNPVWGKRSFRQPVAVARTRKELEDFVDSQRVDTYEDVGPNLLEHKEDYTFFKCFKKDGPLESYNAPDENAFAPLPSLEQALEAESRKYRDWFNKLVKVGDCDVYKEDKPTDGSGERPVDQGDGGPAA